MANYTRRTFLALTAVAAGTAGFYALTSKNKKKVVVIGGGASGVIAAKYIHKIEPDIDITIVEQNQHYYTCFMSNEVIGGTRTIESIKYDYNNLQKYGINIVYSQATGIDPNLKQVHLQNGDNLTYDRLIVSPGISFNWNDGHDETLVDKIPHAWKAGPQTTLLQQQLQTMKNGDNVIITVPSKPFRCPPGPYERASLIAQYFKRNKPKSKVLIFDSNQSFAKQNLFTQGWEQLYGYGTDSSLIEWIPPDRGGKLVAVDAAAMAIHTSEATHKAAVINVIPPQKAGKIAIDSGLTDASGWCPINQRTFESILQKDIYVIGDACIAGVMPKSAYSANSQAKVCAQAVTASLREVEMVNPTLINTCYSLVGDEFGISVAGVYRIKNGEIQVSQDASGSSPTQASADYRKSEVAYAHSLYDNITHEMFD
ncbi:FAD/NAD(P)-binding oxidoreductase [Candidatus Halobeggiatoa sp. HSG11]|nr:FAD/NAD(P)-binding oxidoreductase [Candidatus Halobeggiatoa sp. HSG11]